MHKNCLEWTGSKTKNRTSKIVEALPGEYCQNFLS